MPDAAVTVLERNRADDTYGFGVVFSDETLGAFRDADEPSYRAIAARFRRWDAIETFYRGTCTVSRGHGFAALSRRELLGLLHERCRALGVGSPSSATSPRSASSHLDPWRLRPARRRRRRQQPRPPRARGQCRPARGPGRTRFCWLGTTRPLDAFTFLFKRARRPLQVHAYPYDESMATWIVECSDATWRAAGLVDAGEAATVATCETSFGAFLRGHRLIANRSIWRPSPPSRARNGRPKSRHPAPRPRRRSYPRRRRPHRPLLHRLRHQVAMEDAISLVAALRDHAPHIPDALAAYEDSRRVEWRSAESAKTSASGFEACAAGATWASTPLQSPST
jgi:anthraniloyl-CoA monooxygenase